MYPNLFNFATSELSQDAFFCWLISWSEEHFKNLAPKMYQRSRAFLEIVLPSEIQVSELIVNKIEVRRQKKDIDFLVIINNTIVILFEDKVETQNHSHQLYRYSKIVAKEFPNHPLSKIYLKSDYIWMDEKIAVEKDGYKVIDINCIFGTLISGSENEIYEDFYSHIKNKLEGYKSYTTSPCTSWSLKQWFGFYQALSESPSLANTRFGKYHSGESHWFLISWKKNVGKHKCNLSLEIFSTKLCIKAHIDDNTVDKRAYRNELMSLLKKEIDSENYQVSNKIGKHMTLLVFNDLPVCNQETKIIDFDKSLEKLKSLLEAFEKVVQLV